MQQTNTATSAVNVPQYIGADVRINGKLITHVLALEISQQLSAHNLLMLKIPHEEVQSEGVIFFDGAEELLGKYTEVVIYDKNDKDSGKRLETKFYITDVQFDHEALNEGILVLKGCSPTWVLDGAPAYESFCEETLASAVRYVAKPLDEVRTSVIANPIYTLPVKYLCRFNENAWNFLRRLAADTNQFLYFDGRNLIFGAAEEKTGPALIYGQNCYRLSMNMRMRPVQSGLYDYEPHIHDSFMHETTTQTDFKGTYRDHAFTRSRQMTPYALNYTHPKILPPDEGLLVELSRSFTNSTASNMYEVAGESTSFQMHVGMVVGINAKRDGKDQWHTDVRISSITHKLDAAGNYSNEFTGISAACKAPPPLACQRPQTYPLPATVLSNDDPQGKGRIKVQFIGWRQQHSLQETDWIRVLTPHAGGGGNNDQPINRGMVWIPEKSDQVMIDFEQGNPDRPVVIGSVFHGRNGRGGGENNHIKSIITRTGHTIEFDDNSDGTHILIKDPGGNEIYLDTEGKNITITAPETITLNCKNMVVNVEKNMDVTIGQDETKSIGQNKTSEIANTYSVSSGNKKEDIRETMELHVNQSIEQTSGDIKITTQTGDMVFRGAGKTLVQGRVDARISKG
ncbi:phage baseplate assembly protein V [Danxiaibacter flavus]|uniref:Phage baseplate assembly protein V n=1 Tax=Danxiaibacter flavus TaxID=3049108 RepID=A0ABV3ZDU3_9BACT|nr:phage baseplate assembly protein V [Chitinophagaceae bacterium DXS]